MKCLQCKKELSNPKAKFCSGACRMKFKRNKSVQVIEAKKPEQGKTSHRSDGINTEVNTDFPPGAFSDFYCPRGCDGKNCPSGFKPNNGN